MEARKQKFINNAGFIEDLIDLVALKPWIIDKKKELSELYQICETRDESKIVSYIVRNFLYLDGNETETSLKNIAKQIGEVWKLSPEDTCIACKDIDGKTDSSAALQQMIKRLMPAFGPWKSNINFRSNLAKIMEDESVKNIVIIDDFSGTGKSLRKLIKWFDEKSAELKREKPKIFCAFIAAQASTLKISEEKILDGLFHVHKVKKLISESGDMDAATARKCIVDISTRYGGISRKIYLGYEDSEAAFNLQNLNTPNNVFPIFWKYSGNRIPMFPRIEKQ